MAAGSSTDRGEAVAERAYACLDGIEALRVVLRVLSVAAHERHTQISQRCARINARIGVMFIESERERESDRERETFVRDKGEAHPGASGSEVSARTVEVSVQCGEAYWNVSSPLVFMTIAKRQGPCECLACPASSGTEVRRADSPSSRDTHDVGAHASG